MNAFKRWLMKHLNLHAGQSGSFCVPMPDQKLVFVPRRGDNLVRIEDDVVYIRSGASMPWRELEQAKKELG